MIDGTHSVNSKQKCKNMLIKLPRFKTTDKPVCGFSLIIFKFKTRFIGSKFTQYLVHM